MSDITNSELSRATRNHYEKLINRVGEDYINYRWKRHPVSRSHYHHTRNSVQFAFGRFGESIEHLMEIGSGPGTWTDICVKNTKRMTIVDISSEMLKLVRDRFVGFPIEYHCGDFLSHTINLSVKFDVIFSARAVEYMDDKRAMVEKSATLLEPEGELIIITKNPGWMDKKRALRRQVTSEEGDIHRDWINWRAMEQFFRRAGLVGVVTYPVCVGSYHFPLNTSVGIGLCDLLQRGVYRRKISPVLDFLTESYMVIGRKPGLK